MTLESEIKHAEQVAVRENNNAQVYDKVKNDNLYHPDKITCEQAAKRCRECAAEHRQIAEWLKILKSAKFEYDEAWRTITHPTPDVTYADKQRAQMILDKFRNSLGAISALHAQDVPDTNVGDIVSRQKAIDALKRISFSHWFECGEYLSEDTREIEIINSNKALEVIEALPSAQPEIIRCKDCKWWSNDDYRECSSPNYDDGYVTPAGFYCGYAERRTDEQVN